MRKITITNTIDKPTGPAFGVLMDTGEQVYIGTHLRGGLKQGDIITATITPNPTHKTEWSAVSVQDVTTTTTVCHATTQRVLDGMASECFYTTSDIARDVMGGSITRQEAHSALEALHTNGLVVRGELSKGATVEYVWALDMCDFVGDE